MQPTTAAQWWMTVRSQNAIARCFDLRSSPHISSNVNLKRTEKPAEIINALFNYWKILKVNKFKTDVLEAS